MNKKIGLICNTYIHNYGSVLQSYALYSFLQKHQFDVEVVNYKDHGTLRTKVFIFIMLKLKKILSVRTINKKVKEFLSKRSSYDYRKTIEKRSLYFDQFIRENIKFSDKCNTVIEVANMSKQYQTILLGSDQLWGPQDLIRDYHTLGWANQNQYTVTYATSFGVSQIPSFLQKKVTQFIKDINVLSIREKSGADIIEKLCNRKVPVVVDPTLMCDEKEWESLIPQKRIINDEYVFCYFLGENSHHREWAKKISTELNLKLVGLRHLEYCETNGSCFADETPTEVGPIELLNLIKNANYVVSDSFHVSIFSILFRKQFLVFDRYNVKNVDSRNARITNLLSNLCLSDRQYNSEVNLIQRLTDPIDFEQVFVKLNKWRQISKEYLLDALRLRQDYEKIDRGI